MKINKTNAMRQLDAAKIKYEVCSYEVDESDLSGTHIAEQIGLPYEEVFKTIVTKGDKTGYTVFCIPCHKEIDLKRAAQATRSPLVEPNAEKLLQRTSPKRRPLPLIEILLYSPAGTVPLPAIRMFIMIVSSVFPTVRGLIPQGSHPSYRPPSQGRGAGGTGP